MQLARKLLRTLFLYLTHCSIIVKTMTKLIKRYGSRKLYDTAGSRYISLEEISQWIREGGEIQVVDNQTLEDVTVQTLTQVISDAGRRGTSMLGTELLHDIIRFGEVAVSTGVRHLQEGVDRFVSQSLTRLEPVQSLQEEVGHLKKRLEEMEARLHRLADGNGEEGHEGKVKRKSLLGRFLASTEEETVPPSEQNEVGS